MATRPRITIIGAGFVGTSLGLALTRARGQGGNYELIAHDKDATVSAAAKKRGAVDRAEWNLPASVDGADLIFLAIPVDQIAETLDLIRPALKAGVIVTDTGGTKAQVMEWAAEKLPPAVNFIGGDPLLGRDGWAVDEANADVFNQALYCLTPAINADPDAIRILADFVASLGAQPYFLDPLEHDGIAGAVAHLPFLLSWAYLRTLSNSPSWAELQKAVGPNALALASLAGEDASHWEGLALTSPTALGHWIDVAIQELQVLKAAIVAGDPDEIHGRLAKANADYGRLLVRGREEENPLQDIGKDRIRQMFLGGFGGRRKDKNG